MLPNEKRILPEVVGCDLHGQTNAVVNGFNKIITCPAVAFSNSMRNNQLCVRVNTCPKPEISALFLGRDHSTSVATDKLPLFIHFDSQAGQVSKISVCVIRKR